MKTHAIVIVDRMSVIRIRAAMESGIARAEGAAAKIPVLAGREIQRFPGRFVLLRDVPKSAIGAMAVFVPYSKTGEQLYQL